MVRGPSHFEASPGSSHASNTRCGVASNVRVIFRDVPLSLALATFAVAIGFFLSLGSASGFGVSEVFVQLIEAAAPEPAVEVEPLGGGAEGGRVEAQPP